MKQPPRPKFTSFLIKVASRCNLNCSYCYMYQHADQSWKSKPLILSEAHQDLLVTRLEAYVATRQLKRVLVVYHGGEPLIFGVERILNLSKKIEHALKPMNCRADFGIQTNGLLLTKGILKKFERSNISVSLSIDGPSEIHDEHRMDHKGKPSFEKVYNSLLLLKQFPSIFSGCIAVINPNHNPRTLFDFFSTNGIQEFNILLPDANHLTPPKWRESSPEIYVDWLIKAFDCWIDEYPHIHCKFFESILMAILGHAGQTDALGLGDVSMLNIETDGTYHDLDVLKITEENYSYLGMSLDTHAIQDAEQSEKINFHRKLLTKEGLNKKCLKCEHLDVCGGGSVPHRFGNNGYDNPTVYCREMIELINHMKKRFDHLIRAESSRQNTSLIEPYDKEVMQQFWRADTSNNPIRSLQLHLVQKNYARLRKVLNYALDTFPQYQDAVIEVQAKSLDNLKQALLHPPVFAWLRAFYAQSIGTDVNNVEGFPLPADPSYFDHFLALVQQSSESDDFCVQEKDPWYNLSLGKHINLEHPHNVFTQGLDNLNQALEIIENYDPLLYKEIKLTSRHIQLVKDTNADPEKDVSFSDETLPGALFIGVWKGKGLLSPHMVAASIIHEHLHQKLYLLQQRFELFLEQNTMIFSPWPNKLRPPSGALHAVYVFTHVAQFWSHVAAHDPHHPSARSELETTLKRLGPCIQEINQKVQFTDTGRLFFECLMDEYESLLNNRMLENV